MTKFFYPHYSEPSISCLQSHFSDINFGIEQEQDVFVTLNYLIVIIEFTNILLACFQKVKSFNNAMASCSTTSSPSVAQPPGILCHRGPPCCVCVDTVEKALSCNQTVKRQGEIFCPRKWSLSGFKMSSQS